VRDSSIDSPQLTCQARFATFFPGFELFSIPAEILRDFVPDGVVTETADETTVEKIKQTKQRKTDT
jgi:hypothetical protein